MGTADVEAVWRIESARIVAALTRFTGDFGLAEDAAQEAVAEALVSWLNRAVAVAMASGPAQALAIVDDLITLDRLPGSHLVPTVRGELPARLGRRPEARAELELAARRNADQRERSVLLREAAALG